MSNFVLKKTETGWVYKPVKEEKKANENGAVRNGRS